VPPGAYNFSLYQGDSAQWQFKVWQDAGKTQPADLTGVTGMAEIRSKSAGSLLATLVCTVTLPNIVDVKFPVSQWTTWPTGTAKGVWDLQLTYPGGNVTTIVAGGVTVTGDVTGSAVP